MASSLNKSARLRATTSTSKMVPLDIVGSKGERYAPSPPEMRPVLMSTPLAKRRTTYSEMPDSGSTKPTPKVARITNPVTLAGKSGWLSYPSGSSGFSLIFPVCGGVRST